MLVFLVMQHLRRSHSADLELQQLRSHFETETNEDMEDMVHSVGLSEVEQVCNYLL